MVCASICFWCPMFSHLNCCSSHLSYLIGLNYIQEVANIAQWDDEQIEFIQEKVSEEGKRDDLKKGKEPAQVFTNSKNLLLLFMLSTHQYFHFFIWHIFINYFFFFIDCFG